MITFRKVNEQYVGWFWHRIECLLHHILKRSLLIHIITRIAFPSSINLQSLSECVSLSVIAQTSQSWTELELGRKHPPMPEDASWLEANQRTESLYAYGPNSTAFCAERVLSSISVTVCFFSLFVVWYYSFLGELELLGVASKSFVPRLAAELVKGEGSWVSVVGCIWFSLRLFHHHYQSPVPVHSRRKSLPQHSPPDV